MKDNKRRRAEAILSHDRLVSALDYNPYTGVFAWKTMQPSRLKAGNPAGNVEYSGHRVITINQQRYGAHRLAWFYMYREWPPQEIDHKNVNPDDNRIGNLRKAVKWQNRANQRVRSDCSSGLKGVRQTKQGRWQARIRKHGKVTYLGNHATREEAHAAYVAAATVLFGEYARAA